MPVKIPLIPFIPHRRRRQPASAPPAGPLNLTAAEIISYDPFLLRLIFSRAIDVSGIVPAEFVVQDPSGTGFAYAGDAVDGQPTPESVALQMQPTGSASGTIDRLTAGEENGIVAAGDGTAWAGATDLGLPYP